MQYIFIDSASIFFFNDTATTEIYTLSLHDALPISGHGRGQGLRRGSEEAPHGNAPARSNQSGQRSQGVLRRRTRAGGDRKSTRLNSSHANISYAVFCLKKKKEFL